MTSESETPIEDYLDDLLRQTRADPRTIRRLLDEAGDHLYAAALGYEEAGAPRSEAEREAVRRFGPASALAGPSWLRSFSALVLEVLGAAVLLSGCGLVAVGLSGAIVAVMNAVAGETFVGAASVFGAGGRSIAEVAGDAVTLRAVAGLAGVVLLGCSAVVSRRARPGAVLPGSLTDTLGAAAFAAATTVLVAATIDQAVTAGAGHGVGFFLSGAVVSLLATVVFCVRATRALIGGHALRPLGASPVSRGIGPVRHS